MKRFLSLLFFISLIACMTVTFGSCGDDDGTENGGTDSVRVTLVNVKTDEAVAVFDMDAGMAFSADDLALINNLSYKGVDFGEWYSDAAMSFKFDYSTPFASSVTLYSAPLDKAGRNIDYSYEPTSKTLTFIGYGDMFDFADFSAVPWLNLNSVDPAQIETVVLPEGITSIAPNAFCGFGIKSLVLPKSVKRIGANAFLDCDSLTHIFYAGTSVEYYEIAVDSTNVHLVGSRDKCYYYSQSRPNTAGAYWYIEEDSLKPEPWCYSLKYVFDGDETASFVDYVFISNAKLTRSNISFRSKLTSGGALIEFITPEAAIGDAISSDKEYLCYKGNILCEDGNITVCIEDEKLVLNIKSTSKITKTTDYTEKAAAHIVYEAGSNEIVATTDAVTQIEIGAGISYLGKYIFADMKLVENVYIPASVTSIHKDAFAGCENLKNVYATSSVRIVNDNGKVVGSLDECKAVVYIKTLLGGTSTGNWWREITVNNGDDAVTKSIAWTLTDNGVLYVSGSPYMVDFAEPSDAPWYSARDNITAFVVCDGIVSISKNAISGYKNIEIISLPKSLKHIPKGSFEGTKCFLNTIPSEDGGIYVDNHLIKVDLRDSNEFFAVRLGTVSISDGAFEGCSSLESVLLPESLTEITDGMLLGLDKLEKIYTELDKESWEKGSSVLTSQANVYFYSEQKPGMTNDGNCYWRYLDGKITEW